MANVIFKIGTRDQYNRIEEKDTNTLYWLTDEQALYKGEMLFGTGKAATQQAAGLLSAEDKKQLDDLVKGTVLSLKAVDKSIVLTDSEDSKEIKVGISTKEDNLIELDPDDETGGLYVGETKFALEKKTEGAEDYAAVYRLKMTKGGVDSYAEGEINIPKDIFFKTCELKVVKEKDRPYQGAEVGDPYLDVTLTDDTHSYIPMKGLVDTSNLVEKELTGANGKGIIFNEGDGGGAKFVHSDGMESFVGVNDGGQEGLAAQIYADVKEDGAWCGSRINVFHNGIYYVSKEKQKDGKKINDSECEIAILGDIAAAKTEARALFDATRYEVINLLEGCRVDMNGKEIRVMFPDDAPFVKPSGQAEGRDPDCYYFGLKVYAPSDDITGFKESDKETVPPETPEEYFPGSSSGIDKYGRKYDVCWFPAAKCSGESDWTYYGDASEPGMCVGWYHTIEWYKGDKCVGSETVRINLTNDRCHNSLKPSLGKDNTPAGSIEWESM